MSKFPQIHVGSKYKEFLSKLSGVGKPQLVDVGYIKTLGFKSSYDERFLPAIKFIGLVEDKRGGGPTERWNKLRSNLGEALSEGLRDGYSELFHFYPDAHLRDEEALANYFRGNSDGDAEAVKRMVTAFVSTRELSDFTDEVLEENSVQVDPSEIFETKSVMKEATQKPSPVVGGVNINIQLQLPSDATGEIYDKFFEAMKKHGLI